MFITNRIELNDDFDVDNEIVDTDLKFIKEFTRSNFWVKEFYNRDYFRLQ